MKQVKRSKADKLNRLRSILNGTMSFDVLRPPKSWFITFMDDLYEVECGKKLTVQEFEEWKRVNVREQDSVVVWREQRGNEPIQEIHNSEIDIEVEPVGSKVKEEIINDVAEMVTEQPTNEPTEQPEETVINHKPKKRPRVIRERITSGLLSEYGETWGY